MASLSHVHLAGKEEFLRVHVPELLTVEGKKYYAYLDFPDKQVDLFNFWQRSVQKIFFFCARSAVLSYQFLFEVLSVDGFQPFILPMVVLELADKGELGVVVGSGFARILLEKNSFPQAKKELQELAKDTELDPTTQIICYEYLEAKLRSTEAYLAELFRARPFLTDAEIYAAVRASTGADDNETEIIRALLLVATPIRIHDEHHFNSATFATEEEVSRQFMLFELENAVTEGDAVAVQSSKVFSKGNISALFENDEKSGVFGDGQFGNEGRRQLAYNRLLHEFVSTHKNWNEIVEFNRNIDYVKLKAASLPQTLPKNSEQKLLV